MRELRQDRRLVDELDMDPAVAEQMNQRGILTRRGRRWHVSNVRTLLTRMDRNCGKTA